MKFLFYNFSCMTCKAEFKAPALLCDFLYGEFAMHTAQGEVAYFPALSSVGYQEVSDLVKLHPKVRELDKSSQVAVLQGIFGPVTCDLSPRGEVYHMDKGPFCSYCGSHEYSRYTLVEPFKYTEEDVPDVYYTVWQTLKDEEKKKRVDQAIPKFDTSKK